MRAHERTFKPPRLKSQICLIGGNGFVYSSLNELNSNYFSIALNAAACAVIPLSEASLSIEDAPKNPSISGTLLITYAASSGSANTATVADNHDIWIYFFSSFDNLTNLFAAVI